MKKLIYIYVVLYMENEKKKKKSSINDSSRPQNLHPAIKAFTP